MRDYEELMERLREEAREADTFKLMEDFFEAADAIEELSMKLHGDEAAIAGMKREIERMVVSGNKPRWISVTERLPDGRDNVLTLTSDCDVYICEYIPTVKQFWSIPGDELHIDDITHWMLLPELPDEEQK